MFTEACEYLQQGNPQRAAEILKNLTHNDSSWDEAHSKLGICYILLGRRADAINAFHGAIKSNKNFVPAYSNLCLAYAEEEEFELAVEVGQKGLNINPEYLPLYNSLAFALKPLGRLEEAIAYMRQALLLNSNDISLIENLGVLLYESGEKQEAQSLLEDVVRRHPAQTQAHRTLAAIKRYQNGDPHITQMDKLSQSPALVPRQKADLHFALGKAYEDMKDYQLSFKHYKTANDIYRSTLSYSINADQAFFEAIKNTFSKDYIESHSLSKKESRTPIFILGMPRSGTSLVEQILASHPEVQGAGELNYLEFIQFKKHGITRENYELDFKTLSEGTLETMAAMYLDKAYSGVSNEAQALTDKMPHNFRYIGLIRCLFPHAKVIRCRRDPMDVCFSIYKTKFSGDMSFAYSLKEIGEHYMLYEDLMEHWKKTIPDFIYDMSYEDLVNNQERTTRSLLEFCGLKWNEQCMSFHETKRAVTTASALQVKQPIYKNALQYWRNYEPYLDDLKMALNEK
ncbi:MAG: sulfotransferase [Alphaproteobacteria bacterium]|nr:sulfotransferase [Alphaproteobacteria bacterium]